MEFRIRSSNVTLFLSARMSVLLLSSRPYGVIFTHSLPAFCKGRPLFRLGHPPIPTT